MSDSHFSNNLIATWIGQKARVLDLGCGSGGLLKLLQKGKGVTGIGVEIDESLVASCLESGLQVIQADIEGGLDILCDKGYDCVILSQTLQELHDPTGVLLEMLRVGKQAIVSINNAGHLATRLSFLWGKTPASEGIGKSGIHRLVTVSDFERLCVQNALRIRHRCYLGSGGNKTSVSWLARVAVYLLEPLTENRIQPD